MSPEIAAALIQAGATVLAAGTAAVFVVWQIGKQSKASIDQNRDNRRVDLKVSLYRESIEHCRDQAAAFAALSSKIATFRWTNLAIWLDRDRWKGRPPPAPVTNHEELTRLFSDVNSAKIDVVRITEEWQIIDRRLDLFRTAINATSHDLLEVWNDFIRFAANFVPPTHDEKFSDYWRRPEPDECKLLIEKADKITELLWDLAMHFHDFQIEVQNLLLSDLFDGHAPPRQPNDPSIMVLSLDKYDEQMAHLLESTAFGKMLTSYAANETQNSDTP